MVILRPSFRRTTTIIDENSDSGDGRVIYVDDKISRSRGQKLMLHTVRVARSSTLLRDPISKCVLLVDVCAKLMTEDDLDSNS